LLFEQCSSVCETEAEPPNQALGAGTFGRSFAHNEGVPTIAGHEVLSHSTARSGAVRTRPRSRAGCVDTAPRPRESALAKAAAHAGRLETGVLALVGLARELDAELAAWNSDVADARAQLAKPR
jgi:hypothetical protein